MRYSVKRYLNEDVGNLSNSMLIKVSQLVFSVTPYIPLTPKMMKRILGELKQVTTLHITNTARIPSIVKLGKSSKSLSTFNSTNQNMVFNIRAFSGGNQQTGDNDIVWLPAALVLEGEQIIDFTNDVFSVVDPTGRRWVLHHELVVDKFVDKFESEINRGTDKILKKYKKELGDISKWKDVGRSQDTKLKSKMISEYLDMVEKLIQKNVSKLNIGGPRSTSAINEILLRKFKIKKIYLGTVRNPDDSMPELNPIDVDILKTKLSKIAPTEWVGPNWDALYKYLK